MVIGGTRDCQPLNLNFELCVTSLYFSLLFHFKVQYLFLGDPVQWVLKNVWIYITLDIFTGVPVASCTWKLSRRARVTSSWASSATHSLPFLRWFSTTLSISCPSRVLSTCPSSTQSLTSCYSTYSNQHKWMCLNSSFVHIYVVQIDSSKIYADTCFTFQIFDNIS